MQLDPQLKQWATETQSKYLDTVNAEGSIRAAAKATNTCPSVVSRSIKALKKRAALAGYAPESDLTHAVPEPFKVRGTSTLYNAEGAVTAQWVKTAVDDKKLEEMREAMVAAMAEDLPRLAPSPAPAETQEALCNVYTLTDSHVGALAWHMEGGADWDLKIAEAMLVGAFQHMVSNAPAAKVAFVNQLGDFMHYDGLQAVTPTSGHLLDADGRFAKMVEVAVRILRRVVDFALERHSKVVLLIAEGNHDMASSVWLRCLFNALYENEPRIQVISSPLPYYVYQHGQTMLGFHHGHLKKNDQLPILFAAQFPTVWGATTKRYAHVGHRHHLEEKEHSGMIVHQHPTLAARDAYAARGGWLAERNVTALTYHSKFGEVARNTVTPEMLA